MNKNYPIYKTTFIDDMRSLVEEAAQNFKESTAISYKENYWDKEEGWIYTGEDQRCRVQEEHIKKDYEIQH